MLADEMKKSLGALSELSARTEAADRRIHKQAIKALDSVNQKIEALRPQALASEEAGARYRALILQRGKLAMVVARARHAIKKS